MLCKYLCLYVLHVFVTDVQPISHCSIHWGHGEPSNTPCKPTLVLSTSIIIFPATCGVAAGGTWGQLVR